MRSYGTVEFSEIETHETHERDRHMLACLVDYELPEAESAAFDSMREWIEHRDGRTLSPKQREWVERVCDREGVNKTPERLRKPVPRGREVALAPVLIHLPKKPPGRR